MAENGWVLQSPISSVGETKHLR